MLTPGAISALKSCLTLTLFFYIPYLALLTGGTAVSLALNTTGEARRDPFYRGLAENLVHRVLLKRGQRFIIGLVPLFPISIIYGETVFRGGLLPSVYWWGLGSILFSGFIFLSLFRKSLASKTAPYFLSQGLGTAALLLFVLFLFLFFIGTGYVVSPEKWPFIKGSLLLIISWSSLVTFLESFAIAAGVTGVFMAVIPIIWKGPADGDERPTEYLQRVGTIISLVSTLLLPPLLLLYLATLPVAAVSTGTYIVAGLSLVAAFAFATYSFLTLKKGERKIKIRGALLYGVVILALVGNGHMARSNALQEQSALIAGGNLASEAPEGEKNKPSQNLAVSSQVEKGKQVHQRICSGCHKFDRKVVGPPLNSVLPKYRGKMDLLKGFVKNPVKVNPDYPPMPKLGLTDDDIDNVARFLLDSLKEKK
jgi:cytochrome c